MKTTQSKLILASAFLLFLGKNLITAQSIAAGGWHSLIICNDSTVKAFGENATGKCC